MRWTLHTEIGTVQQRNALPQYVNCRSPRSLPFTSLNQVDVLHIEKDECHMKPWDPEVHFRMDGHVLITFDTVYLVQVD